MPPMYINAGAWVDEGTMVDSHALVGSCAQIGKRVHLSAAAQIGGVLEPINASPVVIEDDVLVGGNSGVYEGTIVRKGAVLAAGTILTRGTPVFDLVNGQILRATADLPLIVPENAVVVPGSRAVTKGKGHPTRDSLESQPLRPRHRQIPRRKNRPVHHPRRPAPLKSQPRLRRVRRLHNQSSLRSPADFRLSVHSNFNSLLSRGINSKSLSLSSAQ